MAKPALTRCMASAVASPSGSVTSSRALSDASIARPCAYSCGYRLLTSPSSGWVMSMPRRTRSTAFATWSDRAMTSVVLPVSRSPSPVSCMDSTTTRMISGGMSASICARWSGSRPSDGTKVRTTFDSSTVCPGLAWNPSPRPVRITSPPSPPLASTTLLLNTRSISMASFRNVIVPHR